MDAGQVFGLIFTLILVAFLLVFGFNQIRDFFCLGSDAQVFKQVKDLEVVVEDLYTKTEGSSVPVDMRIPSDGSICFLNIDDYSRNFAYGWDPSPYIISEILNNPRHQDYQSNLWVKKCGGEEAYKIANLKSSVNFCTAKGDEIFLENKGFYVEVSRVSR